jgi:hypothetical protein
MAFTTPSDMGRLTTGCVEYIVQIRTWADVNQDLMERFWSNSIFKYLRVEPEDHYFLLTEPVRLATSSSIIVVTNRISAFEPSRKS